MCVVKLVIGKLVISYLKYILIHTFRHKEVLSPLK
jgi:hypothetical protein